MTTLEEPGAVCVFHPDRPAEPCRKCGSACCESCLVVLKGDRLCAACKHKTLAGSFTVTTAPSPEVAGVAPPAGSVCAAHPASSAFSVCERCGDFVCDLCTTPFEGRHYCMSCFELQWNRGGLRATQGDFNVAALFGTLVGLLALGCFWSPVVAFFLAAVGLSLGLLGLRPSQTVGRGWAILATVISCVSVMLALGVLVLAKP